MFLAIGGAVPPVIAVARNHERHPSTGLRSIAFAQAPPDFSFDLGAGTQDLRALRGKPVVLNFWATWCGPCRDELDAFERLHATYGDAVKIVTISGEAPGVARTFLRRLNIDLPVVEDSQRKIFTAYSVSPIPVTLVLGPDGIVSYVSIGEVGWDELHAAVEAASPAQAALPAPSATATLTAPPARATLNPNASTPTP